jgi:hypothetical protein
MDDDCELDFERSIWEIECDTVSVDENISEGEFRERVWLVLIDIVSVNVFVIMDVGVDSSVSVTDWVYVRVMEPPRRRLFVAVREYVVDVVIVVVPLSVIERVMSSVTVADFEGFREYVCGFVTVNVEFSLLRESEGNGVSESDGEAVLRSLAEAVFFADVRVTDGSLDVVGEALSDILSLIVRVTLLTVRVFVVEAKSALCDAVAENVGTKVKVPNVVTDAVSFSESVLLIVTLCDCSGESDSVALVLSFVVVLEKDTIRERVSVNDFDWEAIDDRVWDCDGVCVMDGISALRVGESDFVKLAASDDGEKENVFTFVEDWESVSVMVEVFVSIGVRVSEESALLLWVCGSVAVEESGWNDILDINDADIGVGEGVGVGVTESSLVSVDESDMLTWPENDRDNVRLTVLVCVADPPSEEDADRRNDD